LKGRRTRPWSGERSRNYTRSRWSR